MRSPEQTIDIARALHRNGCSLEEVLANPAIAEAHREAVRTALAIVEFVDDSAARRDSGWTDRLGGETWYYWQRLADFLATEVSAKRRRLDLLELGRSSLHLLSRLPDPQRPAFECRGLVVGHVQSGKTANYSALIARAADAGYRLIIVLAGIHNSLREQTQERLDAELTGHVLPDVRTVGLPPHGRRWIGVTRRGVDFDAATTPLGIQQGTVPILAVVKKNCTILESLITWLDAMGTEARAALPALIIDDEADQASINTGGDRGSPAVDGEPQLPGDVQPSRTNALVRRILGKLPRRAYVAYTATPFANVLTDPLAWDRTAGDGLYPTDFIVALKRQPEYLGAAELFVGTADKPLDAVRIIAPDEEALLRPSKGAGKKAFRPQVTLSLREAVEAFVLAGAARLHRGIRKPHSMLVHTSHLQRLQASLASEVRKVVADLRGRWRLEPEGLDGVRTALARRWLDDFMPRIARLRDDVESFEAIAPHIETVFAHLDVVALNSDSGAELAYEDQDLHVIAVGGNRLSRGLTLEGLTVSYFLRTTAMYDTLLQMGRWFGYRPDYEDLVRIYTTADLRSWFADLALVEEDLRAEIGRMEETGVPPHEAGIRIRAHHAMTVTARNKSKHAVKTELSFSGAHPQTIVLPLQDHAAMARNLQLAKAIMRKAVAAPGGAIRRGVSVTEVLELLDRWAIAPESRSFDGGELLAWLRRMVQQDLLLDWTVYVPSRGDATTWSDFGGIRCGHVDRTRLKHTNSIGTLIDPKDEAVDLEGGAEPFKKGGSHDTGAMRRSRPPQQGLLLLYPISPASAPASTVEARAPLFEAGWQRPEAVMGLALSLPDVRTGEASAYLVNRRFVEAVS